MAAVLRCGNCRRDKKKCNIPIGTDRCIRCIEKNFSICKPEYIKPKHQAPAEAIAAIQKYSAPSSNTNCPVDRNSATDQTPSAGHRTIWSNNQLVNPDMNEGRISSNQAQYGRPQTSQYQTLSGFPTGNAALLPTNYAVQAPYMDNVPWSAVYGQDTSLQPNNQWTPLQFEPPANQAVPLDRVIRQGLVPAQYTNEFARGNTDDLSDQAEIRSRRRRNSRERSRRPRGD